MAAAKVKSGPDRAAGLGRLCQLNGLPVGHGLRPLFAWYGDMDLFSHLVKLSSLGTLTIRVEFHPAVPFSRFGSRKALSDHCQREVAAGVDRAIRANR